MGWRHFGGSLLFAAAAGLAAYPLALVLVPWVGWAHTAAPVFALAVALYAAGLLRGAGGRCATALGMGALAVALGLAGAGLPSLAVSLGAALALVRSGFAGPASTRPLRALAVELVLGTAALGMLLLFDRGSPGATAFAVWAYFLVQSAHPLVGGRTRERSAAPQPDPFDEARRHAERLLEGV